MCFTPICGAIGGGEPTSVDHGSRSTSASKSPANANRIAVNPISSTKKVLTLVMRSLASTGNTRNDHASTPKIAQNCKALFSH